MRTCFSRIFTLGMAMGMVLAAWADELVIESFDRSGQLTFGTLPSATDYRIEWASTPAGPWSNSWSGLDFIEVHPRQQQVTRAVPMYYRVVATVTPSNPPPPDGMVLIPAGSFDMGDSFSEESSIEIPVHTVYVNAFYMDRYEVTKALWHEVYVWAVANGYWFDNQGSGKAENHPVHSVSWHDAAKWCNARSQKEGRTACYTVEGNVYKTGRSAPDCNWSAGGYRLPTEAEWEKAARGGASGHRFPWSDADTIQHARANYFSESSRSYDTSPTRGSHPTYNDGVSPYTSPAGSFAANGYGLYDMAGNVGEWCWDWYSESYYGSSPGNDPRGPSSGLYRMTRGGSWDRFDGPSGCRVANRGGGASPPEWGVEIYGFRTVMPAGQ